MELVETYTKEPTIPEQCTESLSTVCLVCPQYHILKVPESERTWARCTGDYWFSKHQYNWDGE